MSVIFVGFVGGRPLPLQRARFSRGRTYNPSSKDQTAWIGRLRAHDGFPCEEDVCAGPVAVKLLFYFRRPKCHHRKLKNVVSPPLKSSAPRCHLKRPDLDNLAKFCLDCCNGILFKDDSQVVAMSLEKRWAAEDEPEGTHIEVRRFPWTAEGATQTVATAAQKPDLPPQNVQPPAQTRVD